MCLFCWTQRKIFWRMWETEQFWGTIDFHSIIFSCYGSQWCPKTAWLQTFFKICSFVFSRTKKFIQVWNNLRVSKWWQNFHFWVYCLFKKHAKQCFLIIQKLTVVSGFHVSWVHSIGIIVFLLCKLYFLSPYPKPTPCTKKRFKKKKHFVWFIFLIF